MSESQNVESTSSTCDYLVSSVVGLSSSALIQPILSVAGFKSTGVVTGTAGAKLMSLYGGKIATGSFLSLCQSAGVLGVSMATTATVTIPVALSTYGVIKLYQYQTRSKM
eukprot:gene13281-11720_t